MFSLWKRFADALARVAQWARADDPLRDRRSVELLARIAHAGRQPLSAALVACELIRQMPDDARRERACIVMDRQLLLLARLFDDLLEATRLKLGTVSLQLAQIDLRVLVQEVVDGLWPQVSEKHQQLASGDNTHGEGLGIGLAVARQLVELHGGVSCASSEGVGHGSEFVVTLPATRVSAMNASH